MQLKNVVFAASLAATATAAPAAEPNTFGAVAIHSGSGVQYSSFNAAKSSIFAGLRSQNASCARPKEQDATFYIQDGALYLYDKSATPQEIFVDRSGMGMSTILETSVGPDTDRFKNEGQGIIGYTTGAQPAPRNSERKGWAIKNGHLQFAGEDFIACPNSIDGAWSIWASAGVANPGGNENCVGIAARVEKTSNPNPCHYTE